MAVPTVPRDQVLEFLGALDEAYKLHGAQLAPPVYVNLEGFAAWEPEYLYKRQNDMGHEAAVEATLQQAFGPVPQPPPSGGPTQPLVGYLRRNGARWADDSGLRSVRGCSLFPLVRWMHDRQDQARTALDLMIGRYQLVRCFWHLKTEVWVEAECDVSPEYGWFDEALVRTLRECWDRQIRVHLTCGDLQLLSNKPPVFRRVASICKSVNQQVVSISEMVNEARVNSTEGEDWDYWAMLSREWQATCPWGMHVLSDPGTQEEPSGLLAASRSPATAAALHGTRQGLTDSMRRAFNVRYEGVTDRPILEGEPTGIDTGATPGVYQGTTNHAHVFGLYAVKVLTGQALTHFDSAGLGWHHYPIDREWGFRELPQRWKDMLIPEDIGSYRLIPGHRAEAPITITGIPGPAPGRCDNMVAPDAARGYAVISGETATTPGQWQIRSRQPIHEGRIWTADGPPLDFTGSINLSSSLGAVVVEWHR